MTYRRFLLAAFVAVWAWAAIDCRSCAFPCEAGTIVLSGFRPPPRTFDRGLFASAARLFQRPGRER